MADNNGSFLKEKREANEDRGPNTSFQLLSPVSPMTTDKFDSNLNSEFTLKQKIAPVLE